MIPVKLDDLTNEAKFLLFDCKIEIILQVFIFNTDELIKNRLDYLLYIRNVDCSNIPYNLILIKFESIIKKYNKSIFEIRLY